LCSKFSAPNKLRKAFMRTLMKHVKKKKGRGKRETAVGWEKMTVVDRKRAGRNCKDEEDTDDVWEKGSGRKREDTVSTQNQDGVEKKDYPENSPNPPQHGESIPDVFHNQEGRLWVKGDRQWDYPYHVHGARESKQNEAVGRENRWTWVN